MKRMIWPVVVGLVLSMTTWGMAARTTHKTVKAKAKTKTAAKGATCPAMSGRGGVCPATGAKGTAKRGTCPMANGAKGMKAAKAGTCPMTGAKAGAKGAKAGACPYTGEKASAKGGTCPVYRGKQAAKKTAVKHAVKPRVVKPKRTAKAK